MLITRRIKLGDFNYYIKLDCVYKTEDGYTNLCLKDYKDDYYDGGDLQLLIEEIEKNYDYKKVHEYYKSNIYYLNDCLYIYDNIPFIAGIGDIWMSSKDGVISSISYITREELDDFIKENNISMKDNSKFKLVDGRTWNVLEFK